MDSKIIVKRHWEILTHTSAFLKEDGFPISSRGNKYNKIIKFIYRQWMQDESAKVVEKIKKIRQSQKRRNCETLGSGLKTIFLPSNLNELFVLSI